MNNIYSNWFELGTGVPQGCVCTTLLFNVYSEPNSRTIFDDWAEEITVSGRKDVKFIA